MDSHSWVFRNIWQATALVLTVSLGTATVMYSIVLPILVKVEVHEAQKSISYQETEISRLDGELREAKKVETTLRGQVEQIEAKNKNLAHKLQEEKSALSSRISELEDQLERLRAKKSEERQTPDRLPSSQKGTQMDEFWQGIAIGVGRALAK